MSTNRRKSIYVCLALAAVVLIGIAVFCFCCNEKYTDVAVLSTTDMHGKGWDINLLTDQPEKNSMLSVATAAAKTREEFGEDNVILIDNGDLYQGTPFSQLSLTEYTGKEGSSVPSMSVCLEKAGYDAFIPGNHEFDYSWDIMSNVYKDLEENGIPVVTCNVCYDGSDGTHEKGDTVFTPYITKTIKVNGNEHKIGILGIGNTDITRWTDSANYPGMTFAHPDNQKLSAADEASMYIPEMKKEGCEFIIVSYHGGMGDSEGELEPLVNTNNQGERLAAGAEGIDLLITGHDHFSGYSNTAVTGPDGKEVPVVNGGGTDMTKCVFRFSEDGEGSLKWELTSSENLQLSEYESDEELKTALRTYAESTEKEVSKPVGTAEGSWDNDSAYFTSQTDTMNFVSRAMLDITSEHGGADMSMSTVTPAGSYTISAGDISQKDVYSFYQFSNTLAILPLKGSEIRAILEENAAEHLAARILEGKAYYYSKGDVYANIITGGLNFTYDMSQPEGSRVIISGFSDGKSFDDNSTYNVAVITYLVGNENCGLREYTEDDLIWGMDGDSDEGSVQELIIKYLKDLTAQGKSITPEMADWKWSIDYSGDKEDLDLPEGDTAAVYSAELKDGKRYVIRQESEGCTFTSEGEDGSVVPADCPASGNTVAAPLPDKALILTAHDEGDGSWSFTDQNGRSFSHIDGNVVLSLDSKDSEESGIWKTEKKDGGYYLLDISDEEKALQLYNGRFMTFRKNAAGGFYYNFYEVTGE